MTAFRLVLLFVLLCGLIASIPRLIKRSRNRNGRGELVVNVFASADEVLEDIFS